MTWHDGDADDGDDKSLSLYQSNITCSCFFAGHTFFISSFLSLYLFVIRKYWINAAVVDNIVNNNMVYLTKNHHEYHEQYYII